VLNPIDRGFTVGCRESPGPSDRTRKASRRIHYRLAVSSLQKYSRVRGRFLPGWIRTRIVFQRPMYHVQNFGAFFTRLAFVNQLTKILENPRLLPPFQKAPVFR